MRGRTIPRRPRCPNMKEFEFVHIGADQLTDIIKECVSKAIEDSFHRFESPEPVLMDSDQICVKFGITKATLQNWRDRREIPFIQIGGVIRYDYNKIVKVKETKRKR